MSNRNNSTYWIQKGNFSYCRTDWDVNTLEVHVLVEVDGFFSSIFFLENNLPFDTWKSDRFILQPKIMAVVYIFTNKGTQAINRNSWLIKCRFPLQSFTKSSWSVGNSKHQRCFFFLHPACIYVIKQLSKKHVSTIFPHIYNQSYSKIIPHINTSIKWIYQQVLECLLHSSSSHCLRSLIRLIDQGWIKFCISNICKSGILKPSWCQKNIFRVQRVIGPMVSWEKSVWRDRRSVNLRFGFNR